MYREDMRSRVNRWASEDLTEAEVEFVQGLRLALRLFEAYFADEIKEANHEP